jgi:hypothetical protein
VILRSGQSGALTAHQLEEALRAAPTPREPRSDTGPTSRRLLITALLLTLLAVGVVAVGSLLSGGSAPVVVPTPTSLSDDANVSTVAPEQTTTIPAATTATPSQPTSFDPFGEGGEGDQSVAALIDNDVGTEWQTERYLDPLELLKPGVGVTVRMDGIPSSLQIVGLSDGSVFDLYWSAQRFETPDLWERVASGSATPGTIGINLPSRTDGFWLLWLTELTQQDDGTFQTSIAELRFEP